MPVRKLDKSSPSLHRTPQCHTAADCYDFGASQSLKLTVIYGVVLLMEGLIFGNTRVAVHTHTSVPPGYL